MNVFYIASTLAALTIVSAAVIASRSPKPVRVRNSDT